jgi:Cyclin-dependent kinase inhibitor 3 (CDKN3)
LRVLQSTLWVQSMRPSSTVTPEEAQEMTNAYLLPDFKDDEEQATYMLLVSLLGWGMKVRVLCYEGYKAEETPRALLLGERKVEVVRIEDGDIPDAVFEKSWETVGTQLREELLRGGKILIHCKGGLGRSGMIAARLLVELGAATPEAAIRRVRVSRPGAIETREQERHVLGTRVQLKLPPFGTDTPVA